MEKIFIKPTAQEILIKGSGKEGHVDLFSYDNEADEAKRKLGNLYILGNVQTSGDTETEENSDNADTTYVINLVASLAKREYYAHSAADPKEAFSATLKKINDVIEEFFKNKHTRINIGIFSIANENIYISKLGKFKIMLARSDRLIDILNNIDLFNKEQSQEKEFSNIISGKVHHGDRILAFYPARTITAREKSLRDQFLKSPQAEFIEKLESIKKGKTDFCCAAFYINVSKTREQVVISTPEVQSPIPSADDGGSPTLAAANEQNEMNNEAEPIPSNGRTQVKLSHPDEELMPRIIPSEFSLGRKENKLAKSVSRVGSQLLSGRKSKFIVIGGLLVITLGIAGTVKSFLLVSPETKRLNAAIEEAQSNLNNARSKIDGNDISSARALLVTSINSLNNQTIRQLADDDKNVSRVKASLITTLDELDRAYEANLSLVSESPSNLIWPESVSSSLLPEATINFTAYESNLYVLKPDGIVKINDAFAAESPRTSAWLTADTTLPVDPMLIAVDGKIYVLSKSGMISVYYKGKKESEMPTNLLINNQGQLLTNGEAQLLYVVDKNIGRIYGLQKDSGALIKTLKIGSSQSLKSAALAGDGTLYLRSGDDKIWKVVQ